MRIVAFDLSLTCTGWCDGEAGGTLTAPKARGLGVARLDWIRQAVVDLAAEAQLVAIEGYSYGSDVSRAHSLGELGGLVRWVLWQRRIPLVVIPPASLKQFATGKGNARKEEVLAAAIRNLGYSGHSNDEADARWLWTMTHAQYSPTANISAARRITLSKIEWPSL